MEVCKGTFQALVVWLVWRILKAIEVQEQWLSKIEDRTDKVGNKAGMLELRMERLTYDRKDCARHVGQIIRGFDRTLGGSEVLQRWIQAEQDTWRTARMRWHEGCSEEDWKALMKDTLEFVVEEVKAEMDEAKEQGDKDMEKQLVQEMQVVQLVKEMEARGCFKLEEPNCSKVKKIQALQDQVGILQDTIKHLEEKVVSLEKQVVQEAA